VLRAGGVAALGALVSGLPVDPALAAFSGATALGTAAFVATGSRWLLLALALASGLVYGRVLPVSRQRDELRLDSPLVELVRRETRGGELRFAWCGSNTGDTLGPNQEALYGLASVHSYNPLFSARYQRWAARYRKTQVRGTHDRRFLSVIRLEEFLAEAAAPAGVGVMLSTAEPVVRGLAEIARFGTIAVYRPRVAPVRELQLASFERDDVGAHGILRANAPSALDVRRVLDEDETKRFEVTPHPAETLLSVGQQYHPGWRARAGGRALETLAVDDVFQGVLVPPGTSEVELAFTCAARWSWVPQLAFALGGVALAIPRRSRARARRGPA
jgi:hypothetical protein